MSQSAAYILAATADNFAQLVVENSRKGLVVLDVWADWAGPSLRQKKILSQLAHEFNGRFLLVTLDAKSQKPLVDSLGIKNMPSMRFYQHGEMLEEFRGFQGETAYSGLIEKHLGRAMQATEQLALQAWQNGERDKAIQQLAEAAMQSPQDLQLSLTLAKMLVSEKRHQQAYDVLHAMPLSLRRSGELRNLHAHLDLILSAAEQQADSATEDSATPEERLNWFAQAGFLLLQDQYEQAVEELMKIVRLDRKWQQERALHAVYAVLELLRDEQVVDRFRRELFQWVH
ncbi:MAG: tetratricopeptide repeat protein [gamma proteobacterium symbiont of Bathyaustriella thionipta]|nr:tetratricopeptide repeat protein [gamma proteobacterium symbiont of Bathyaustriella thionipta]